MADTPKTATTKERILDAAEHLFSEKGFAETSLRDITTEAGANLAAVNYHFQSKDALIDAMFARRIGPVNAARIAMLERFEEQAGGGPVPVECILRAFIEPVFRLISTPEGANAARLIGRMFVEPGDVFERMFTGQFAPTVARFMAAARRALPGVPETELYWRIHFAIGVLGHTVAGLRHISVTSGGLCDITDVDAIVDRLVAFVAAGVKGEPPCKGSR
jgi:AcrR family transcriptional regulator